LLVERFFGELTDVSVRWPVDQLDPGRRVPGQTERDTKGEVRFFPRFEKFSYQNNLPTLNPAILGRATSGRFNAVHGFTQRLISGLSDRMLPTIYGCIQTNMNSLPTFFLAVTLVLLPGVHAASAPPLAPVDSPELIEKLLDEYDSREAFVAAVADAEKRGASVGLIVKAHLLSGLREYDASLLRIAFARAEKAALVPRREVAWLMVIARAHLAGEAHQFDEAERLFKEAFWMEPQKADTVGRAASYTRRMQRMAAVTLDLDRPFRASAGGTTTLRELMKGKKALLLDFWASWCKPCLEGLPALKVRQQKLGPLEIAVAGINTDKDAAKAERVRRESAISFPWLLDAAEQALGDLLSINSIPRAVVISPEGKILYNGDPANDMLDSLLAKLVEAR
jgi:thiol-disulfide isomerase/thioredoxin